MTQKTIDRKEVRKLIEKDKSDREIAEMLKISISSVQKIRSVEFDIRKKERNREYTKIIPLLPLIFLHGEYDSYYRESYHFLATKGYPIRRIKITTSYNIKNHRSPVTVYYLVGQEKQVFSMLKNKYESSKLGSIARMLKMPSQAQLMRARDILGIYKNMKEIDATAEELRNQILIATERKKARWKEKRVRALRKKLKELQEG